MKHPAHILWTYSDRHKSIEHARAKAAKIKIIKDNLDNPLFVETAVWALNPTIKFRKLDYPSVLTASTKWGQKQQLKSMFYVLSLVENQDCFERNAIKEYRNFAAHSNKDTIRLFHAIVTKNLRCGAALATFRKAGVEM